jgi:hypothetical protein
MSAQRLSPKSTRRIATSIGEPVLRAWGHGGYTMDFVTPDHRHGWWEKKTGEFGFYSPENTIHYDTCHTEMFPDPSDWYEGQYRA